MSKYISFQASRIYLITIMNDSFGILGESNFHDIMKMKNLRLNGKEILPPIVHQNNPSYFKIDIEILFEEKSC